MLDFTKRARTARRLEARDQTHVLEEALQWEEAIAAAEDADELEEALRLIEEQALLEPPSSQSESSTGRKRRAPPTTSANDDATVDELFGIIDQLKEKIQRKSKEGVDPDASLPGSVLRYRSRTTSGRQEKKLTQEERWFVLHMHEYLLAEKRNGKTVSTADPKRRLASYLGMAHRTVTDAILNRNVEDRRGKNPRYIHTALFHSDLRKIVGDLNAGNKCVSVSILRNRLKEAYGNEFTIPSKESIRSALKKLGFKYKTVNHARNYEETDDIKKRRKRYLQEKWSEKYNDAAFVYLDESYCNLNHVSNK
ncbi:hypothetical protein BGZ68_002876, partial [Mortierella alpina]